MNKLKELSLRLHAVSVMRDLLEDKVIKALMNFLDLADEANEADKVDAYTFFVSELYKTGAEDLSEYVKKIVFESENVYVKLKGKGEVPSAVLAKSLENELKTFDEVASLSAEELLSEFGFLPRYYTGKCDISKEYIKRLDNISKYGYGIYAKYRMFYIGEDGQITPVQNPDETKLSDLIDYKRSRM